MNSNGQEDGGKHRETGDLVWRKAGTWIQLRGSDKPERMRAAFISSQAPRPEHCKSGNRNDMKFSKALPSLPSVVFLAVCVQWWSTCLPLKLLLKHHCRAHRMWSDAQKALTGNTKTTLYTWALQHAHTLTASRVSLRPTVIFLIIQFKR